MKSGVLLAAPVCALLAVFGVAGVCHHAPARAQRLAPALRTAVETDDVATVDALLNAGVTAQEDPREGPSLVAIAVQHLQPRIVALLLAYGFDPNACGCTNRRISPPPLAITDALVRTYQEPLAQCGAPSEAARRQRLDALLAIRQMLLDWGAHVHSATLFGRYRTCR